MVHFFIFVLLWGHVLSASNTNPIDDTNEIATLGERGAVDGSPTHPNMKQCVKGLLNHEDDWLCIAGNGCVDGIPTTQHNRMELITIERDANGQFDLDKDYLQRLINCDVAATLEIIDKENHGASYQIEYNTNAKHIYLPMRLGYAELSVVNGRLVCNKYCILHDIKKGVHQNPFFFSGVFEWRKRANLTRCDVNDVICFIGSSCINQESGPHKDIVRLSQSEVKSMLSDPNKRRILDDCDLGVIITAVNPVFYTFMYHSKLVYGDKIVEIALIDQTTTTYKLMIFGADNIRCFPNCRVKGLAVPALEHLYYEGAIHLKNTSISGPIISDGRRANLSECFQHDTVICFTANSCVSDTTERPTRIEEMSEDRKLLLKKSQAWIEEAQNCEVGATMSPLKDFKNQENIVYEEVYEFAYHTKREYFRFRINLHGRIIWISNKGEVLCKPNCKFDRRPLTEEEKKDPVPYWIGTLRFERKSTGSSDDSDSDPQAMSKGNEKEQSNLGTILIICGCSLVAIIILVVVVGTIIQRNLKEKNQRRLEAIQQAVKAKSSPSGCSMSHERKKAAAQKEETEPLIESTPLAPNPTELTTYSSKEVSATKETSAKEN